MLPQGFSGSGRLGWAGSHGFRLPGGQLLRLDCRKICNESGSYGALPAGSGGPFERDAVHTGVLAGRLGYVAVALAPNSLAPEIAWKLRDRAPPFDSTPLSLSRTMTRVRHSHGTRRVSLTVASFRTWRGWQVYAAWDPAFNISNPGYRLMDSVGGRNSTPL